MKRLILLLCLPLSVAAQEAFQLETETSGCFLPRVRRVVRWELRGDHYKSAESEVVLSVDQVDKFRNDLLALPHEDYSDGPPDWDQFDPRVRVEAFQKLTEDYGLRPELKDIAVGLGASPSSRLMKEVGWFGGTEWVISFSGAAPLKLSTSGSNRPLPMLTLEQASGKWKTFSYQALDFFRLLEGKIPGAELEFYLAGDEARWQALKELQDQPRFSDWEESFRIKRADSASVPKYILDLVPRRSSLIDTVSWRAQALDSYVCLSSYNGCLARLEGRSWLKHWKSASAGRRVELNIGQYYDAREWERAGLPGNPSHELELRGPTGQLAKLLVGEETEPCLLVSNSLARSIGQHWLDTLTLKSGQVALITNDGTVTKLRLKSW